MIRRKAVRRWRPDPLKLDLERMYDEHPEAFVHLPGEGELQRPPVSIWLAAWATDLAQYLHERYDWRVALVVGNMQFPYRRLQGLRSLLTGGSADDGATPIDPDEFIVCAERPLVVQSGHKLHDHLVVRNMNGSALQLSFAGPPAFSGIIIDPASGAPVNGSVRVSNAREGIVEIAPGGVGRIPLEVDTASSDPALGYAVPTGNWELQVVVHANGRTLLAPRLPISLTSGPVRDAGGLSGERGPAGVSE